jgi:two-component system, NarL family, sensor histidine kinase UhpB
MKRPHLRLKRRDSLLAQTLAVNVLLISATLFAASVASGLDLNVQDQRWQFLILAMAILLTLLVNFLMLRRRFTPLERLIDRIEAIDPAQPSAFELPGRGAVEEIDRLAASFRALLERIEAERRRSGRLVFRAQEEERRRLARDLHDEVNQALTAIVLRLEALSHDAPAELAAELAETKRLANQAMNELLTMARQLRPTALDDHGLVPAIEAQVRQFKEQTGIGASLAAHGDLSRVGDDQQLAIYRVTQEALTNVARHSRARHVGVQLAADSGRVELRVEDDGAGFDPSSIRRGLGLDGMAERARLLGGQLDINSRPEGGTEVSLRLG